MTIQDLTKLPKITDLPTPQAIYKISQSIAMLDAIFDPQGEFRYFTFDQYWGEQQAMAAMRDGEGSHYFILFGKNEESAQPAVTYAIGKLYDKALKSQGLTAKLDIESLKDIEKDNKPLLQSFLDEAAFDNDDASLYFYQFNGSPSWSALPEMTDIPFLGFLANQEAAYAPWASDYHEAADDEQSEVKIDAEVVAAIFAHEPLNKEMIYRLNPLVNLEQLVEDILDIGYPVDMG